MACILSDLQHADQRTPGRRHITLHDAVQSKTSFLQTNLTETLGQKMQSWLPTQISRIGQRGTRTSFSRQTWLHSWTLAFDMPAETEHLRDHQVVARESEERRFEVLPREKQALLPEHLN